MKLHRYNVLFKTQSNKNLHKNKRDLNNWFFYFWDPWFWLSDKYISTFCNESYSRFHKIHNYFFLWLNSINYEHKMKNMWTLYLCSLHRDGERSFTRKNAKYRLVLCQSEIAIFSSIKSDRKEHSREWKYSENMSKSPFLRKHKNYMAILPKVACGNKSSAVSHRETNRNNSKNLKWMNYILIRLSLGLLMGIKFSWSLKCSND